MENASAIPDNMDFDASQLASVSLLPNKLTIYLFIYIVYYWFDFRYPILNFALLCLCDTKLNFFDDYHFSVIKICLLLSNMKLINLLIHF